MSTLPPYEKFDTTQLRGQKNSCMKPRDKIFLLYPKYSTGLHMSTSYFVIIYAYDMDQLRVLCGS